MDFTFIEEEKRFAAYDQNNNEAGEATFSRAGENILIIDHTSVKDDYRGQGVAGKLVKHIVEKAREHNQKIMPLCPFAKGEFDKHQEYRDVLHS
ncbi:GNAT family N-acetyltransferase [Jeotgalibacillus salarius]|uniref:N-acetyltransferase n=1 Tax=Jeotgalibacillus salarius TaxID=546023 RepID=A0A4Y8LHJ3_9BACL|nr:GNAT family N-acetyltransferase [Jeotgalibacillus salarius]TFE02296.1 N-acetyltransferase [Jeotgalibacillus salarius]